MYPENQLDTSNVENLVYTWGPRILAAIAILVVAYFVGRAVKWALAKGIDRLKVVSKHNTGRDPKETLGAQLGELGFWLILLVGVVAALGVLQLTAVATPLNSLLTNVFSYIPNLVGAIVIFVIGMVLANLARKVVEAALNVAHVDSWIQKAGLGRLTGASGLAKLAGTLVFVLIIIPVAIAALQQLGIAAISGPAVAVLSTVLDALPRLIAAAIVLAIAFFIGRWIAGVVEQILSSLGFDRSIGALGLGAMGSAPPPSESIVGADGQPMASETGAAAAASAPSITPSKVIGQLVLWAIMLFSAVEAARLLNFAVASDMLAQILELASKVLFGGIIITAGILLAQVLSKMIDRSTGGADQFASTIVKWATIALAVAMGLRFMGIADEIVILAFGLILGSAAVAAALAFGLGGREAAGRVASRWAAKAEQRASSSGGPSTTPPPPGGSMI
ncbi:MAG TPA: mechanosensitive ion channel [Caulobacteraceae bacterium]|jgi:hypothetical protein